MSSFLTPRLDSFVSRNDVFGNIETLFNDVFDGMASRKNAIKGTTGYPRMDMFEIDKYFYIQIACAGLSEKDIDVSISEQQDSLLQTGKYVTIKGGSLANYNNAEFHLKGLTRSSFSKTIRLPENISGDPIATMENGLLTLCWRFIESEVVKSPKKIEINKGVGPVITGTTGDLDQSGPDLTKQKQKK